MLKTDKHGFLYYDQLPDNTRLATMDDFHHQGNKHIGMKFIIHGHYDKRYELYKVTENTTAGKLKSFIDNNMVYVFTKNQI